MTTEATYRWTREAYDRAVEAGVFGPDDRLELIDGTLLAMTPRGSRHAAIVDQAGEVPRAAFGAGCRVRILFWASGTAPDTIPARFGADRRAVAPPASSTSHLNTEDFYLGLAGIAAEAPNHDVREYRTSILSVSS